MRQTVLLLLAVASGIAAVHSLSPHARSQQSFIKHGAGIQNAQGSISRRLLQSCVCATIFAPVCGSDGNTYSNECQAKCANVTVASTGACAGASTVLPNVTLPDVTDLLPNVTLPDVTDLLPNVTLPNITLPDLPDVNISLPNVSLPSIDLPDLNITLPNITIPSITDAVRVNSTANATTISTPIGTVTLPGNNVNATTIGVKNAAGGCVVSTGTVAVVAALGVILGACFV